LRAVAGLSYSRVGKKEERTQNSPDEIRKSLLTEEGNTFVGSHTGKEEAHLDLEEKGEVTIIKAGKPRGMFDGGVCCSEFLTAVHELVGLWRKQDRKRL